MIGFGVGFLVGILSLFYKTYDIKIRNFRREYISGLFVYTVVGISFGVVGLFLHILTRFIMFLLS